MKARVRIEVEPGRGGRVRYKTLSSEAPLSLRPTEEALYLVSSAANMLGGDSIDISVSVGREACLEVRSVGATQIRPANRHHLMAKLAIRISLEPGALLLWLPEPTVIQRNAHLQASLHMEMGIGSKALIREDLVLGRYGETGGTFSTAWNISSWEKPLLRSTLSSEIPDFESCAVMGRFRSLRQIALVDTEPESLAVTDPPHIPTMFGLSTSQALCRLEEGGFVYQGLSEELMDLDAPARYIENFFIKMVQR